MRDLKRAIEIPLVQSSSSNSELRDNQRLFSDCLIKLETMRWGVVRHARSDTRHSPSSGRTQHKFLREVCPMSYRFLVVAVTLMCASFAAIHWLSTPRQLMPDTKIPTF